MQVGQLGSGEGNWDVQYINNLWPHQGAPVEHQLQNCCVAVCVWGKVHSFLALAYSSLKPAFSQGSGDLGYNWDSCFCLKFLPHCPCIDPSYKSIRRPL